MTPTFPYDVKQHYFSKIGTTRLKRDYQKFPLKRVGRCVAIPFKEDIEYM